MAGNLIDDKPGLRGARLANRRVLRLFITGALLGLLSASITPAYSQAQSRERPTQAGGDGSRQLLHIAGYSFDPLREQPRIAADLASPPPSSGAGWWIVQLRATLTRAQRAQLMASFGLKLDDYYPNLAYLERIDAAQIGRLRGNPLVRTAIVYQPAFKLSPTIGKLKFTTPERQALGFRLIVTLFPGVDPKSMSEQLRALGASRVEIRAHAGKRPAKPASAAAGAASQMSVAERLAFNLPAGASLAPFARLEGVRWIEEFPERKEDNGTTAGTIQSGTAGTTPVWNGSIHGEGQIVGVIDSGAIDINHCMFQDPADNTARPDHRKMLDVRGVTNSMHATFVGGIVAGEDFNNPGTGANRGNAWAARLVSGVNSEDMDDALEDNKAQGAFIHTNSWHDDTGNPATYNQTAEDVDTFTWNNEEHLVLGSMGNNGEEQGPPGTAKNAVGVQATMRDPNENSFGDGNNGPTADGRRKPDVSSPGCTITSAAVNTACTIDTDANIFGFGPICATSWATPSVAAAAALVRQYYTEGFYPSGTRQPHNAFVPSGALLKATLLNGTLDMTGPAGYPSNTEGWGVLRLDNALYFPGDPRNLRVWDVRNASGLASGETQTYGATIASNAQPLKVTLVWTDPPGNSGDANPVINNLDLTVISPDGTQTFLGNQFGMGGTSVAGGASDALNNVEQVSINTPAVGTWTIRVTGTAVNVGAPGQGYALVVTSDAPEPPAPTGEQDTLIVRVTLSDLMAGSPAGTPAVQNLANDLVAYVNETSYGRASIDPVLFPNPVALAHTKSFYFAANRNPLIEMTQEAVMALMGMDANVFNRGTVTQTDDIDRIIIVINDPSFTGDFATTGPWPYDLPGGLTRPLSVSIQTIYNDATARWAHGMSHQLGMWDLGAHPQVVFAQPHVDEWDNMAAAFARPHQMAWSKERAGWLTADGNAPFYVPRPAAGASTQQTLDLNFLTDTAGQRAIAIGMTEGAATLAQEDVFFMLEARRNSAASGFDDVLPETGVLLYNVEENVPQGEGPVRILDDDLTSASLADAALEVGDSKSPPGRGLNVAVLAGGGGADRRIQIDYDPPETDNDVRITRGDPAWMSPDIWVDSQRDGFDEDAGRTPQDRGDQAVEGEVNRLYFRIRNAGPGDAFDFMVRVRVSEPYHTVGGDADFNRFAGEIHVDTLASGAELVRYIEWIPETDGSPHSCVEVTFPNVFNDINASNNRGQKNLEEVHSSHGSPYEPRAYAFGLTNEEDHAQLYYFRTEGVPEGWSRTLSPTSALLNAGERIDGAFTVQPPDNAMECTNHRMHITSWKAAGDTLVPVGGGAFQVDLRSKTALGLSTQLGQCQGTPGIARSATGAKHQNQCLTLQASGCTNPPRPNEQIIVRYETPDGVPVYHTVTTDAAGCYADFLVVTEGGPWQVTAEYPGGNCSGGDRTPPRDVLVPLPPVLDTDGDGVNDPEEPQGDHDHDGLPGFQDPDSDNDSVPDGEEAPGDCDQDGLANIVDTDSDNDGIADGRDKESCGARPPTVADGRRSAYSFHVGSTQPLGSFDQHADANVYWAVDGSYKLNDRWSLAGTLGLAQFTEETASGADHQRITHLSLNAQTLFGTPTPLKLYLQAGPGFYDRKIGGSAAGFNAGFGALYPVSPSLDLQWGGDLHHLFGGQDERFYTVHFGVLWR